MKKIILVIMITMCTACVFDQKLKEDPMKEKNDDSYIEVIPDNARKFIKDSDSETILTLDEIYSYNKKIQSKTDSIFELDKIQSMTSSEITNLITQYKVPSLPKYTGNGIVSDNDINQMLDNRNINDIEDKDKITKGLIVKRTNLKSFPTDVHFFDSNGVYNFDRIQETELHVNTPILIIHESKDHNYSFVIAYNYSGWVKNESFAIANDKSWEYFVNNDAFGIITEPFLEIDGTLLDMSTKLPYKGVTANGYKLVLPLKNNDGYVDQKEIIISRDKAHVGYLLYNKKNVYIQAFKYENIPYRWSGMDDGVDCSSYISNVYRTFGFMFPRNTADQNSSVGEIINLENKTNIDKLNLIEKESPALLFQNGHVMIYLGKVDNNNYIIHASGSDLKVVVTELNTSSSYLNKINKIVYIK